ncbi:hypothetical protein LTV02_19850 [Nocardia yamanashiensis]|uniref:esterase/lipase family protein n=1 Tax=Nocardia yamanashiensis TaxID=209247 RepID=UPI001E39899A|nr:hypothetical protein [Nocardia yamanashiensis]UGT45501.1 hypothetical protein LTV02_19850 [Nocardia yamanashiensis]
MRSLRIRGGVLAALSLMLGATAPAAAEPLAGSPGAWPVSASSTIAPVLDCVPAAARPEPVILLAGFGAVGDISATIDRQMSLITGGVRAEGGCAYPFAYGIVGPMHAAAPIAESAVQVAGFVDEVLSRTGAGRVDIVAHSSGALVADYYLKFLGGAPHVRRVAQLAPVTHGTTATTLTAGLTLPEYPSTPADFVESTGLAGTLAATVPAVRGALDCLAGAAVITQILDGGVTVPGVEYSVLATRFDQVLTPPGTASFIAEPGVRNDFYEDLHPEAAPASHAALPMQPGAAAWVLDRLYGEQVS